MQVFFEPLHDSPEIKKELRNREMENEHTINRYRLILLSIFALGDTITALLQNKLNTEFIIFTVVAVAVFGPVLYYIHKATRSGKYLPALKYITVTLDLFIIFGMMMEFLPILNNYATLTQSQALLFATILFISFNMLGALRIQKPIIFYSTTLAMMFNFILHWHYESSWIIIIYTSLFVEISGFFNLWVSKYIVNSIIAQQNLEKAMAKIKQANEEISAQRDYVVKQRDEIAKQKQSITDSITYASRIQKAVLPQFEELNKVIDDYFVFFKPKDIVSGDFYWVKQIEVQTKKYQIVSAIDCTGHGVPGAFMSMLGTTFLNDIAKGLKEPVSASEILERLRILVKNYLHQSSEKQAPKDGMDMSLCVLNYETKEVQFAGANNPLYIIHDSKGKKEFEEVKATRNPIGIYS